MARITKSYIRKRQKNPSKFDKRSFRTKIPCKKNREKCPTKIIVGCPRGKYDAKRKRCKVATQVQSVLKRRKI